MEENGYDRVEQKEGITVVTAISIPVPVKAQR
jgi:hypothetical protein